MDMEAKSAHHKATQCALTAAEIPLTLSFYNLVRVRVILDNSDSDYLRLHNIYECEDCFFRELYVFMLHFLIIRLVTYSTMGTIQKLKTT